MLDVSEGLPDFEPLLEDELVKFPLEEPTPASEHNDHCTTSNTLNLLLIHPRPRSVHLRRHYLSI